MNQEKQFCVSLGLLFYPNVPFWDFSKVFSNLRSGIFYWDMIGEEMETYKAAATEG